ncbi:MAG TPA: membrane protein insertion efficiency factor YidD [Candidatus Andersenbacteria bacterium]|nr:membrane protein insertion efficiency factor YidD [Candidatus Andersenbacteria bacterium]
MSIRAGFGHLITLYQRTLSPDHGPLRAVFPMGTCRYYPTCSAYAKEAVMRHGWRGALLAIKRVVRCHPFVKGGIDHIV